MRARDRFETICICIQLGLGLRPHLGYALRLKPGLSLPEDARHSRSQIYFQADGVAWTTQPGVPSMVRGGSNRRGNHFTRIRPSRSGNGAGRELGQGWGQEPEQDQGYMQGGYMICRSRSRTKGRAAAHERHLSRSPAGHPVPVCPPQEVCRWKCYCQPPLPLLLASKLGRPLLGPGDRIGPQRCPPDCCRAQLRGLTILQP